MNATSSRAHTIVGITFVQKSKNARCYVEKCFNEIYFGQLDIFLILRDKIHLTAFQLRIKASIVCLIFQAMKSEKSQPMRANLAYFSRIIHELSLTM